MAKGDLYKLLTDISDELSKSTRDEVDTYPHVLEISAKSIEQHLALQLAEITQPGRKAKTHTLSSKYSSITEREQGEAALFSEADKFLIDQGKKVQDLIKKLSEDYAKLVYKNLLKAGTLYHLEKVGSDTEYQLKVTYVGPKTESTASKPSFLNKDPSSVFRHIRENGTAPARDYVRNVLSNELKKIAPNIKKDKETIFDLGHVTAVSTFKINTAIQNVSGLQKKQAYAQVLTGLLNFELISKFTSLGGPELGKAFEGKVVYARPESATFNNWQSKYEANLLREVRNAFAKVLDSNRDWANQAGSDSVVTAIAQELLEQAAKRGAKTTAIKKNRASNKATLAKRPKIKENIRKVVPGDLIDKVTPPGVPSSVSLREIIPLLNARLPEVVKANMGIAGRLHNRTGRFAESTQIVDVNGDIMTYSYMKNPYQVFENQGSRDPRNLIEISIRELAVDLMFKKFNLRRV